VAQCVIWAYGHHQASFLILHKVVMIIMSSGDYILATYDMGIISVASAKANIFEKVGITY
jgi:hypothetical protein